MKFTKNELSEALKGKLTNNGKKHLSMSSRTFNRMVEKIYSRLEKREAEDELDDIVEDYIEDFEEVEGDFRKRDSDHAKEKKEWEQSKKDDDDDEPNKKEPDDKLDKLLKEIQEMKLERENEKAARSAKEKKSQLYSLLKEKGVSKEYLEDYDDAISVDKDTDIEALAEKWEKRYNKHKASDDNHYTPGKSGGKGDDDETQFNDIVKLRKQALHITD